MEIIPSCLVVLFGIWVMSNVRPVIGLVIVLVGVAMFGAL